jgi:hypothetical protein
MVAAVGPHWPSTRLATAAGAAHHSHGDAADLAPDARGVGVQQRAGHAHPVEDCEVRLQSEARVSSKIPCQWTCDGEIPFLTPPPLPRPPNLHQPTPVDDHPVT